MFELGFRTYRHTGWHVEVFANEDSARHVLALLIARGIYSGRVSRVYSGVVVALYREHRRSKREVKCLV